MIISVYLPLALSVLLAGVVPEVVPRLAPALAARQPGSRSLKRHQSPPSFGMPSMVWMTASTRSVPSGEL